jgi:hypothetical protein
MEKQYFCIECVEAMLYQLIESGIATINQVAEVQESLLVLITGVKSSIVPG